MSRCQSVRLSRTRIAPYLPSYSSILPTPTHPPISPPYLSIAYTHPPTHLFRLFIYQAIHLSDAPSIHLSGGAARRVSMGVSCQDVRMSGRVGRVGAVSGAWTWMCGGAVDVLDWRGSVGEAASSRPCLHGYVYGLMGRWELGWGMGDGGFPAQSSSGRRRAASRVRVTHRAAWSMRSVIDDQDRAWIFVGGGVGVDTFCAVLSLLCLLMGLLDVLRS